MISKAKKTIWIIITIIVVLGVTAYFTIPSLLNKVGDKINNIYNEDVDDLDIYDEQDTKTVNLESKGYINNEKYGYVKNNELVAKLDKINESTLKFVMMTAAHSFDKGNYNIAGEPKYTIYGNILSAFIDEKDYKVLSDQKEEYLIEISYVEKEKFEKVFTEVTGVENVQEFFADYTSTSTETLNYKEDIIYKKDGEIFYLVSPGYGLENINLAYTNVITNGDRTTIEIEQYGLDKDEQQYKYVCTYTFEISNESLRIYGWNIK